MDWFLYDQDLRHERVKASQHCSLIFKKTIHNYKIMDEDLK